MARSVSMGNPKTPSAAEKWSAAVDFRLRATVRTEVEVPGIEPGTAGPTAATEAAVLDHSAKPALPGLGRERWVDQTPPRHLKLRACGRTITYASPDPSHFPLFGRSPTLSEAAPSILVKRCGDCTLIGLGVRRAITLVVEQLLCRVCFESVFRGDDTC